MAMTHQQTNRTKLATAGDQLAKGFDSLTLDPSPRLRQARKRRRSYRTMEQAWQEVGKALAEAIRLVGKTVNRT
jgi:hypothetical protein